MTLQHPVPWLDQLVAYPIAAPVPPRGTAFSGPFRVVLRHPGRIPTLARLGRGAALAATRAADAAIAAVRADQAGRRPT